MAIVSIKINRQKDLFRKILKFILLISFLLLLICNWSKLFHMFKSDSATYIYYYLNNQVLETDKGKIYLDSFYINKSSKLYNKNGIDVLFTIYGEEVDEDNHIIDFYLYEGKNKKRVSFSHDGHDDVDNFSEIFKGKGYYYISGDVDTICSSNKYAAYFPAFDKLEIEIDGESYFFEIGPSYYNDEKYHPFEWYNYSMPKEILIGDNLLNISSFNTFKMGNRTVIRIDSIELLETYSCKDCVDFKVFIKDSEDLLHQVYLYGKDIYFIESKVLYEDLKETEIAGEAYFVNRLLSSIIFEIDGKNYEVPLTLED